jgi:tetrahydromethanopterin S-methyltransferase subunit E
MTFKAIAGTPISYSVYGGASGTYEMSLVLERLE